MFFLLPSENVNTRCFLMFAEGIESENCFSGMGQYHYHDFENI